MVQGPADAGAMRVRMRAEGLEKGGDEEIVYFCQRRRKSLGEVVVLLTADVNAAVTAASVAGPGDVPVCAFHPNDVQANDVLALFRAVGSFYAGAEERVRGVVADAPQRRGGESLSLSGREPGKAGVSSPRRGLHRPAPRPPRAEPSVTTPRLSREEEDRRGRDPPPTADGVPANSDDAAASVSRVLDALDAAFPPAVEAMLREDLGDMWAVAVRDDAEDILEFTPDDAFEALRKNLMTLVAGRGPRGARGVPSRGDGVHRRREEAEASRARVGRGPGERARGGGRGSRRAGVSARGHPGGGRGERRGGGTQAGFGGVVVLGGAV